ncbi:hypothetical protein L3Q82_025107, partial [Scortum barcoo]
SSQFLRQEATTILYPKINSSESIDCICVNISCDSVYWFRSLSQHGTPQFLGKCNNADRATYADGVDKARFKLSRKSNSAFMLRVINVKEEDEGIYFCVLKERKDTEMWKPGILLRPGDVCGSLILWSLVGLLLALALALICTLYYFSLIVVCNTKMDQKWILVILVFCQIFFCWVVNNIAIPILLHLLEITSGASEDTIIQDNQQVEIKCEPAERGSLIVWFRVLEKSSEFIASFSATGVLKKNSSSFSSFKYSESRPHTLTLVSFNKGRDSGIYTCGSLYKGNELKFGKVTRLVGVKVTTKAPLATTTKQSPFTTATPCVCNNKKEKISPSMLCEPIILGPLAAGCGLLLLLLIITTTYCNKIRTRRCPHHYKRK